MRFLILTLSSAMCESKLIFYRVVETKYYAITRMIIVIFSSNSTYDFPFSEIELQKKKTSKRGARRPRHHPRTYRISVRSWHIGIGHLRNKTTEQTFRSWTWTNHSDRKIINREIYGNHENRRIACLTLFVSIAIRLKTMNFPREPRECTQNVRPGGGGGGL